MDNVRAIFKSGALLDFTCDLKLSQGLIVHAFHFYDVNARKNVYIPFDAIDYITYPNLEDDNG